MGNFNEAMQQQQGSNSDNMYEEGLGWDTLDCFNRRFEDADRYWSCCENGAKRLIEYTTYSQIYKNFISDGKTFVHPRSQPISVLQQSRSLLT